MADSFKWPYFIKMKLPIPTHLPKMSSTCEACNDAVNQYNSQLDDLYNAQLQERTDVIDQDFSDQLDRAEKNYIQYLNAQPAIPENQASLAKATQVEKYYAEEVSQYGNDREVMLKKITSLENQRIKSAEKIGDCEKQCLTSSIVGYHVYFAQPIIPLKIQPAQVHHWARPYCAICERFVEYFNNNVDLYNQYAQEVAANEVTADIDNQEIANDNGYIDYINSQSDLFNRAGLLSQVKNQLKADEQKAARDKKVAVSSKERLARQWEGIEQDANKIEECVKENCGVPIKPLTPYPTELLDNPKKPEKLPYMPTQCDACTSLSREYHDLVNSIFESDQKIYKLEVRHDAVAQLSYGVVHIIYQYASILNPTSEDQRKLAEAQHRESILQKERDELNATLREERQHNVELRKELETKGKQISACEQTYCHQHASVILPFKTATTLIPGAVEVGVLAGGTNVNRSGKIISSAPDREDPTFTASSSSSSAEIGLQAKFIYDYNGQAQPFVYLNGTTTLGTASNINFGVTSTGATLTSKLVVNNNWSTRLGVGIQTEPLLGGLQIGVGVGAAVINQSLKAYISEANTTIFQKQLSSIQPTVMGVVSWQLCQSCIDGHSLSLAGQLSADNYSGITVNGSTASGANYSSSVSQQWVPHADFVLSVKLP